MKGKEFDLGLLVIRVGVGSIILYYGAQQMLGMFGGAGFAGQLHTFSKLGIAPLFGTLAIFAQFFGALGLILGCFTRLAAFGICCHMAVGAWLFAHQEGLLHNVFVLGDQPEAGTLFHPLGLAFVALGIVLTGGGRYALDAKIFGARGVRAKRG